MTSIKDHFPLSLKTDRLVLTTPTAAHVPAIARLANNLAVNQMMARLPFPYAESDARFFVETIVPGDDELCYAILVGGSDFAGIVGLTFEPGTAPQLGYWLGEPFWGNGYATEAAIAVIAAARAAGLAALRSRALLENRRSRRVLVKSGFTETGQTIETTNNLAGKAMVLMQMELGR